MPPGRGGHLTTELSAVESAGQPTPDVPILSLSEIFIDLGEQLRVRGRFTQSCELISASANADKIL